MYAKLYGQRRILFTCGTNCVSLHSLDGSLVSDIEEDLYSTSQEEADTRLILHSVLASKFIPDGMQIVVRSPDTDVLILLVSHCHRIKRPTLFDTGTGNNRRLISVNQIAHAVGPDVAEALLAFHAFTGCDTTSSFVRNGKRGPFRLLSAHNQFISLFKGFGKTLDWLTNEKWTELQQFVCNMYGK